MIPARINTEPGREYGADVLNYAMVLGAARSPQGRLWAAWIAGGDDENGLLVAASSDDDGSTRSAPRLVIDPPDASSGLKCRTLVGNLWTDPLGRLWLFYDQSMGYFDGRKGGCLGDRLCESRRSASGVVRSSAALAWLHIEQADGAFRPANGFCPSPSGREVIDASVRKKDAEKLTGIAVQGGVSGIGYRAHGPRVRLPGMRAPLGRVAVAWRFRIRGSTST